jgi:hypothetical protein
MKYFSATGDDGSQWIIPADKITFVSSHKSYMDDSVEITIDTVDGKEHIVHGLNGQIMENLKSMIGGY